MIPHKTSNSLIIDIISVVFLVGGLVLANFYSFLLFHILVELFSIIISFAIFVVYWNTRRFLKNEYFFFLALSYFFVSVFDLAHILSYKGMVLFPDTGANLPTQLWIIARYYQAGSLIVAALFSRYMVKRWWMVIAICTLLTSVLLSVVFIWPIFPVCYIDGLGFTSFKEISEYVVTVLFVLAIMLLFRIQERFEKRVFWLLVLSLSVLVVSEIMFSLHRDTFEHFNLFGQLLRILSYYLVYKALIQIGLQEPYESLFRNVVNHEAALRISEEKYRAMVENVNEVIFSMDAEGRITYISPVVEMMLGYHVDEATGVYFYETAYPDDHAHLIQNIEKVMRGEKTTFECRLVNDAGMLRWIRVSCRPLLSEGQVTGAQGVMTDITEQHLAEEMLHIKNNAVESAFTGIAVTALDGSISYANHAYATMFGYGSSDEILGKQIDDLVDDDLVNSQINNGLRTDGHWVGDLVCHRKDGSPFNVELFASLVRDEVGEPLCYMGSFLDITERKRIERWRYLYEQLLNSLLELSQSAPALSESDITEKAIQEAVKITSSEMGYLHFVEADETEIHLTSWTEGVMDTCTVEQQGHYSLENAGVWADSIRMREPVIYNNYPGMSNKKGYPDGHVELHRHMSVPIYDDSNIAIIMGVANKLTDYDESDVLQLQLIGDQVAKIIHRKRAEEGLKTSLREKVVLLQEIHHRVKNNLQVVSSLLDMQAMKVKEPQILEVLQDSRNRVRAMAFVHDRLYRSEDLAVITAADYIPSLVNYLFGVYAKSASDIKLVLSIEDVALNLESAVPCGLIINELVSNALKYAFVPVSTQVPASNGKEIRVYVGSQERGHFTMMISDNGVGLPETVDIGQTPSLGLQLVGLLTLQIGGKIELDRTHGTAYKITAPL